jgi:hypothetical protein
MKRFDFINQKISISSVTALLKALLVGLLFGESYYFSKTVYSNLKEYIDKGNHECLAIWLGIVFSLIALGYLFVRKDIWKEEITKISRSFRLDIGIIFLAGLFASISVHGIGTKFYQSTVPKLDPILVFFILILPILIGVALTIRALQINLSKKEEKKPFFISDIEGDDREKDHLGYVGLATKFADRVCNGDSKESMVFGIDAPWGIGKSTFINYCIKTWEEKKYADKIAVYKFSPLRYEDQDKLLEKFIDGLIVTIQKSSFIPEIRPLVSKYSRLIKSKGSFSFFGLEIELPSGSHTIDDVFLDLETALKDSNKKIIVVVDDLDRLTFSAIKDVLYAIKKSFTLSNVSYVLCYDTENIGVFDEKNNDVEKIREFLEKFINVKITLFVDSEMLEKFISDSSKVVLGVDEWLYQSNTQLALKGLREILQSPEYYNYVPFIGDLRKIKRYINILKLFELENIDHGNSDLNAQDLTHLLLIYINYPNIFRKIYNAETSNRKGFFSAVIKYDDYYPEDEAPQSARNSIGENQFRNSTLYRDYLNENSITKEQRFLLEKVFTVSKRLSTTEIDNVPPDIKYTYACFNGGSPWSGGRNLETYLHVIAKSKKPERRGQYTFYLNTKDEIKNGTSIEDVFAKPEFSVSAGESSHQQLWKIIVSTAHEFDPQIGSKLINYLLDHITDYSFFTNEKIGVGLRDDLDYFLVKLLDATGWSDPDGTHGANTEENIKEIAEWIFGEERHAGSGVLEILCKDNRGIIGFYDLMAFRLFCSADRGGDIFNLTRALSKHGNPSAPTEGSTQVIAIEEMREISQKIFALFKTQYIAPCKNIFNLIEDLTLADFAGKYFDYIEQQVKEGKITEKEKDLHIASLKSRMKSFITYQLGNTIISSGVGCGYYDETGEADEKGIATAINDYMFDICFNPEIDIRNYEHFLDYLLINFASVFASRKGRDYIPHIDEFTKVIDRTKLVEYWRTHSTAIKALNLEQKEKMINTGNYIATYAEDLKEVFIVLDKALEDANAAQLAPVVNTQPEILPPPTSKTE